MPHLDLRTPAVLLALAVLPLLSACGGGGGGSPTPAITSPTSSSVWGGTRVVRWVPAELDAGTVQIRLSSDGGASYPTVLAGSTADDGAFTLDTTALSDGVQYRVRIAFTGGPTLTSGTFSIDNTAPVTILTAPVGGETIGGTTSVTWSTTDVHPGTVELRASTNGGTSYDVVIAAAAPDTGSFTWDTSGLTDSSTIRVRVTPTDEANNLGAASESAANFEVDNTAPVITLTSPTGGESWSATQNVTWTTTEANPATVTLTLSTDSGATFTEPVATDVPDSGTYAWMTGFAPDGAALRLRAVATDMAGNVSAPSESASDFTIVNLRLVGPAHYRDVNGNAVVDAGDQLYLFFDKDVAVTGPAASDFTLGVTGDSLGTGASVAMGPESDTVLITLGTSPTLRTRGAYDASATAAGRPSGLDVSASMAPNAIEQFGTGLDAVPSGTKDVRPDPVAVASGVTTATGPTRAALGDFDADGDLDALVADSSGAGTDVLINGGAGTFTSATRLGTLTGFDVALGDVDGDGDLDHVLATGAGVRVSLGDGTGAFAAYGVALGAGNARAVALLDADGDGDLDIFVGNDGGQADEVWANNGAGLFTNTSQVLGSGNTQALAVGDLDRDGDLDVVAASNGGGQPCRVWTNDGAGTFTAGEALTVTAAQDVALGDMDGDGDLDVVLAVLGQNEVHFNDGSASFPGVQTFLGNNDNRGVAVFDLDGDGDLDIATVKDLDAERWWINDGSGAFTESDRRGETDNARGVVAGRLDGDADTDLFVTVAGANHRVYLTSAAGGQPGAVFADAMATAPTLANDRNVAGDVDRDGDVDVVAGLDGGAPRVLASDGAGTFTAGAAFATTDDAPLMLVDLDRDGDLDLFLQGRATPTTSSVWRNDGAGVFTSWQTGVRTPVTTPVDLDGDGDLDYVAADPGGAVVVTSDAAGVLTAGVTVFGPATFNNVAAGDLDLDGDVDLVFGVATANQVWRNDGAGAFTSNGTIGSNRSDSARLVDFDGDGDLDVVGFGASLMLEPVRNDGGLTFSTLALTGPTRSYDALLPLDFDEDGDVDLVTYDVLVGDFLVLAGNGAGAFTATTLTDTVTDLLAPLPADFDGDGDVDLYLPLYDVLGMNAATDLLYAFD